MIRWAAGRPAVIWAFAASLILAGGVAFQRLPLATRTAVELPRLLIQASWSGASPELVETYITSPIESAIQPVRGVRKSSSESREGTTRITVELDPKANVQLTRLGILERLELLRSEFPVGVRQPVVTNYVPEDLAEQPLLVYTVSGPYTPGALARMVEEQVEPRITAVPGVSSVGSQGGAETGIAVTYDAGRLRQLGIQPTALEVALNSARQVRALGEEQQGAAVRPVALRDAPKAMEDLEGLPVRGAGGRVHRLGDLASIRQEEDSRGIINRLNGQTAVTLRISRLAGSDAIKTAARVRQAMTTLQPTLPAGIRFRLAADESVDLAKQLNDLLRRGAIAFLAVMLVLALALRNIKSVWLVMGSAAVSIAGTALGLYLLKIPANLLTLAGLGMGIGILVQNGLIVVERLRGAPDTPAGRAAVGARIFPAVLGATLTTAVVLVPFLYLQGDARAAFVPFASAFALALGWSVVSAVVMIPAVSSGHGATRHGWRGLHRIYTRVSIFLLRGRWVVIVLSTAGLVVLGWGFVKKVPRTSWGGFGGQRTTLTASLSFPRGSDPESLDRAIQEFESIAVGRDGVDRVEAGGGNGRAQVVVTFDTEAGFTSLPLVMQEEFTQRGVLVGGANISVYGRGPAFSSGGGSSGSTFRVKLLGYSFTGLEAFAKDLKTRLEQISRVNNVNINAGSFWGSERSVSVTLEPDRPALARAGVTAQSFAATVAQQIRGSASGRRIEIGDEEVLVTLKAAGARERSLEELRAVQVPNGTGSPVRIGDLATVDEREGLATISREDQQYVRIVSYDFRGPAKLANRTHEAFMKSISVPAGYSASDQQFGWAVDDSGKGLWLVFGAGVVLVLLAVAMVFDSGWASVMVFLSLPLALAGVVGMFWGTKTAFGREAAVGVILVVGLAVNQAILLIDGALERRRARAARGGEWRTTGADVVWAARDRSGMIVLVTLTTLASLLPLAIGTPADSLFGSIALATTGGTIAGTIGALFILPAVLLGGFRLRRRRA